MALSNTISVIRVSEMFFLLGSFCIQKGIGDDKTFVVINDQKYYQITLEELSTICVQEHTSFVIHDYPDLQIETYEDPVKADYEFDVYTCDDHYYVDESILRKFHLKILKGRIKIHEKDYFEISPQLISIVEGSSLYGVWRANYKEVPQEEVIPVNHSLFEEEEDIIKELIPGTNIYKPREKKEGETDEEYSSFLTKYYSSYFPMNPSIRNS